MRFKPGQELVCVNNKGWKYEDDVPADGPKFNELVTANGYESDVDVILKEYSTGIAGRQVAYDETCFEPLVSTDQLMADLKEESHAEVFERVSRERHRSKAWI